MHVQRLVDNPGEVLWGANTKGEVGVLTAESYWSVVRMCKSGQSGSGNVSYSGSAQGKMFRPSEKAVQRKGGLVWCQKVKG